MQAGVVAHTIVATALLGALVELRLAAAAPLDEFLAAPITAGSIGLLSAFRDDPRVPARVAEALSHPSPAVRRAAARVISVSGLAQLAGDARRALDTEQDAETVVELMRAVVLNSPADGDAELIAIAKPLGASITRRLALILAWARGPDALHHIEEVGKDEEGRYDADFLATATRRVPQLNRLASRAIADKNIELWRSAVESAAWPERPLDLSLIKTGLATKAPQFRSILLWQVAQHVPKPRQPDAWLATRRSILALAKETSSAVGDADGDAHFAQVVLDRSLGSPVEEDPAIITILNSEAPLIADRHLQHLDPRLKWPGRERGALNRRAKRLGVSLPTAARNEDTAGKAPVIAVRTISELPSGYADDVIRVANCLDAGPSFRSALVTYDAAGRVATMTGSWSGAATACDLAFQALAQSTLQADPSPPRPQEQLVLLRQRDYLACIAHTDAEWPRRLSRINWDDSKVDQPKKLKDVRPEYPQEAIDAGVHGTVYLSAVISSTGCVNDIRLDTTIHPSVNLAAMVALAGWRFKPALLHGVPTPVRMTAAVSFVLN